MTWDNVWQLLTQHGTAAVATVLLSAAASTALVLAVLVWMPEDYFVGEKPRPFLEGQPLWVRVLATLVKTLVAWVLIALGLVMALPGVPGQGLLTILVGVLLADFPGKRRLERRVVQIHAVHSVVDRVRHRFNRPQLQGVDRAVTTRPPPS